MSDYVDKSCELFGEVDGISEAAATDLLLINAILSEELS